MTLTVAPGCGGSCPEGSVPGERAPDDLSKRSILLLRPAAALTIKRDVHYVIVDVDANTFLRAFHEVMRQPERRFGLIRVERGKGSAGRPFAVGESFQGRYSVEDAGREQLTAKWREAFGALVDESFVGEWLCRIENQHTSDYGRITVLDLEASPSSPGMLKYEYLAGSPIAGSSTFIVRDIADPNELARLNVPVAARLEQIFEYQEQTESFAYFFTAGGLKLHNGVVWSQAEQSAALAKARILESDIPIEYRKL